MGEGLTCLRFRCMRKRFLLNEILIMFPLQVKSAACWGLHEIQDQAMRLVATALTRGRNWNISCYGIQRCHWRPNPPSEGHWYPERRRDEEMTKCVTHERLFDRIVWFYMSNQGIILPWRHAALLHTTQVSVPCSGNTALPRSASVPWRCAHTVIYSTANIVTRNKFFFSNELITCAVGADPPRLTGSLHPAQEWSGISRRTQAVETESDPPSQLQKIEGDADWE